MWSIPFLVIFICVIVTGRNLDLRSFTGRDIVVGFTNVVDGSEFPVCSRDVNGTFECLDETMTVDDVTTVDHVYGFLRGVVAETMWPSDPPDGSAGQAIIGNAMRVVGALKLRQQSVEGIPNTQGFLFDPVYDPPSYTYPPYSTSDRNTTDFPPASDYVRERVLMPWDGSTYGTCSQLNGTGYIDGLNKYVQCDGHALIVPFNVTKDDFQGIVSELAAAKWINVATRNVVAEALLFHLDSTMFMKVHFLFEFQAGGAITYSRQAAPFFFHDSVSHPAALEALFWIFIVYLVAMILRIFVWECADRVKTFIDFRNKAVNVGEWSTKKEWLLFDGVCLAVFALSAAFRLIWRSYEAPADPVWQLDHYPAHYEDAAYWYRTMTSVDGFCGIFSVLATVRYTKFFSRFDVVINTLQRSLRTSAVIMFVGGMGLLAMSISAYVVWGSRVVGFQTIPTASLTLLMAFVGDIDYGALSAEESVFSFFFCGWLLIGVTVLTNMVIAVFADAFSEEQQDSLDDAMISSILANDQHHRLDTWYDRVRMKLKYTWLVQRGMMISNVVRQCMTFCRSSKPQTPDDDSEMPLTNRQAEGNPSTAPTDSNNDEWRTLFESLYNNLEFDGLVSSSIVAILSPTWVPSMLFEEVGREYNLFLFAACLLKLVEMYVPPTKKYNVPAATSIYDSDDVVDAGPVSIYDFALHQFGSFDYNLIMTFLVMVPQARFGRSGISLLTNALRNHRKWYSAISRRSVTVDDDAADDIERLLEKHKLTKDNEPRGEGDIKNDVPENSFALQKNRFDEIQIVSDLRRSTLNLEQLCGTLNYLQRRLVLGLIAVHLKEGLKVSENLNEVLEAAFNHLSNECNVRRYGCCRGDDGRWSYRWRAMKKSDIANIPFKIADAIPLVQREFAPQCLGFQFTYSDVIEFEAAVQEELTNISILVPNVQEERSNTLQGEQLANVSIEVFEKCWTKVRGPFTDPIRDQILSIFPDGKIDIGVFLYYCRGDPQAHRQKSFFQAAAARRVKGGVFKLLLITLCIPLFGLFIYLNLYSIKQEEAIHLGLSLQKSFAPPADNPPTDLEQVNQYLQSTVAGIWSGLPTEKAQPLNFDNYFAGALRVRQVRVKSLSSSDCNRVFENFFGDSSTRSLDFSEYPDAAAQGFYTERVHRDFSRLVSGECFSSFGYGFDNDNTNMNPPPNTTSTLVQQAFVHRATGGATLEAHDTFYPPNGFFIDIPFNSTRDEATSFINELSTNWLDTQTRLVVVEFVAFNGNLNQLCSCRFGYEVTSGGAFHPIRGFKTSQPIDDGTATLFNLLSGFAGAVLGLLLVSLFGKRLKDRHILKGVHWYKVAHHIITINAVVHENLGLLLNAVTAVLAACLLLFPTGFEIKFTELGDGSYPAHIETILWRLGWGRILLAVVILLTFARFIHLFGFLRRVYLLFETFTEAFSDLLVVYVLFVLAVVAFAVGAMVMFGYYFGTYSNLISTLFDLFSAASTGGLSFSDLQPIGFLERSIPFFVVFTVVVCYIMFNITVAIITNSFSTAKARVFDPRPMKSVFHRNKSFGWLKSLKIAFRDFYIENSMRGLLYLYSCEKPDPKTTILSFGEMPEDVSTLWSYFHIWWTQVDQSPPKEACLAGLNLLLNQIDTFFGSIEHASTENPPLYYCTGKRLPVWTEFLYSVFKEDYHMVKKYLVEIPASFSGQSKDSLWMHAVETHHYFTAERKTYQTLPNRTARDVTFLQKVLRVENFTELKPHISNAQHRATVDVGDTEPPLAPSGTPIATIQSTEPSVTPELPVYKYDPHYRTVPYVNDRFCCKFCGRHSSWEKVDISNDPEAQQVEHANSRVDAASTVNAHEVDYDDL